MIIRCRGSNPVCRTGFCGLVAAICLVANATESLAVQPESTSANAALVHDDECVADAEGAQHCGLSALQRRGLAATQRVSDSEVSLESHRDDPDEDEHESHRRRRRRRRRRSATTTTTTEEIADLTPKECEGFDVSSCDSFDCDGLAAHAFLQNASGDETKDPVEELDNTMTSTTTTSKPSAATSVSAKSASENATDVSTKSLQKKCCCAETQAPTEVQPWGACGGDRYSGPTKCTKGYVCAHISKYYAQCNPAESETWETYVGSKNLNQTSEAPLKTFYLYRASGSNSYPLMNVNAASLGGLMWYLHNEVVSCVYNDCSQVRRFGISRILRYKVKTRAPEPLYKRGMDFGLRYAFDSGQCTGPWVCEKQFEKYGYFVGCNNISTGFPFPTWPVYYDGVWYSLPGSCSSKPYYKQSLECKSAQPGGMCNIEDVTGQGTCTYGYEDAGEIDLDELVGLDNYTEFKEEGGEEFNVTLDVGVNTSFWDGLNDTAANAKRVQIASNLFKEKYPNMPSDEDFPTPQCNFDIGKFFPDGLPKEENQAMLKRKQQQQL